MVLCYILFTGDRGWVPQHLCGGQRTTFRSLFYFPGNKFALKILMMKGKSLSLNPVPRTVSITISSLQFKLIWILFQCMSIHKDEKCKAILLEILILNLKLLRINCLCLRRARGDTVNKGVLRKYAPLGRDVPPIISMRRYCAWIQVSVPQLQSKMRSTAECCTNDACQPLASMRMRHPSHSFTAPLSSPTKSSGKEIFCQNKARNSFKEPNDYIFCLLNPKRTPNSGSKESPGSAQRAFCWGGGGSYYNREITSCLTLEDARGLPGL